MFCIYPNMLYKTVMHDPPGLRQRKNSMNFEYLVINPYSPTSTNDQKIDQKIQNTCTHTCTHVNQSKQSHPKAETNIRSPE